jgi:hypothetical protein
MSNKNFVFLKSYNINGATINGTFPIYIKGISQCCINPKGILIATPINVPKQ